MRYVALAVGLMAAGAAVAQSSSALDVIAVRQAGYDLMGASADAMKRAVQVGEDPKPYADAADAMAAWGAVIPSLFPPGSDKGHDTKAKPEIWSDRTGFEAAARKFTQAAEALSEAAKAGDTAAFEARFKETGAACGACHRAYKVKT